MSNQARGRARDWLYEGAKGCTPSVRGETGSNDPGGLSLVTDPFGSQTLPVDPNVGLLHNAYIQDGEDP